MLWDDPTDPEVLAAVFGDAASEPPTEEDLQQAQDAIAAASEILTMATGYVVHPAGEITEEFQGFHRTRRLSLLWGPVTDVTSVTRVLPDDTEQTITNWRRVGQTVFLHPQLGFQGSIPLWRTNWHTSPMQSLHRVVYTFANTVSRAARRAMLSYAHEIFLMEIGSEECGLPERVTSITREGLGIQLMTPQDFLDKGRTGLPSVDTWLTVANPAYGRFGYPSTRPSAVYTPDSPPGIGTRMRRIE